MEPWVNAVIYELLCMLVIIKYQLLIFKKRVKRKIRSIKRQLLFTKDLVIYKLSVFKKILRRELVLLLKRSIVWGLQKGFDLLVLRRRLRHWANYRWIAAKLNIIALLPMINDFYHDVTAKRIYLRPSDILYPCDVISPDINEYSGFQDTILEMLFCAFTRQMSVREIANRVRVVKRKDGRGKHNAKVTDDPNVVPGWWAVKGIQSLWVLKTLEEYKFVKLVGVNHMATISKEHWYALRTPTVKDGGKVVEISGEGSHLYYKEKRRIYRLWIRSLAPTCLPGRFPCSTHGVRALRLGDYIKTKEPRYTKSCAGYGLCHSPVKHHEENHDPNSYEDHRCHRPYVTVTRRVPPFYNMLDEMIDWKLWLMGLVLISFVGSMTGCYFRGCGGFTRGCNKTEIKQ